MTETLVGHVGDAPEAVGTGYVDVTAEVLPYIGMALPHTYRIIGSAKNDTPGTIRIVLESGLIEGQDVPLMIRFQTVRSIMTIAVEKRPGT